LVYILEGRGFVRRRPQGDDSANVGDEAKNECRAREVADALSVLAAGDKEDNSPSDEKYEHGGEDAVKYIAYRKVP